MNKMMMTTVLVAATGTLVGCQKWRESISRSGETPRTQAAHTADADNPFNESYGSGRMPRSEQAHAKTNVDEAFSRAYRTGWPPRSERAYSTTDEAGLTRESYGAGRSDTNQPGLTQQARTPTPDARILSILHAKDRAQIEIGRLAKERGMAQEVRDYGARLERDHTDHDAKVLAAAKAAGIELMDPDETEAMFAREKGGTPPPDVGAELRKLSGAQFDEAFSRRMHEGHRDLIDAVQDARNEVANADVRRLLDETLPSLREHEQRALTLMNGHR